MASWTCKPPRSSLAQRAGNAQTRGGGRWGTQTARQPAATLRAAHAPRPAVRTRYHHARAGSVARTRRRGAPRTEWRPRGNAWPLRRNDARGAHPRAVRQRAPPTPAGATHARTWRRRAAGAAVRRRRRRRWRRPAAPHATSTLATTPTSLMRRARSLRARQARGALARGTHGSAAVHPRGAPAPTSAGQTRLFGLMFEWVCCVDAR
jgi:hypothetical protein